MASQRSWFFLLEKISWGISPTTRGLVSGSLLGFHGLDLTQLGMNVFPLPSWESKGYNSQMPRPSQEMPAWKKGWFTTMIPEIPCPKLLELMRRGFICNGDSGLIYVPMPELALCPFIRDTWLWMHHCYPSLRRCSLFWFRAVTEVMKSRGEPHGGCFHMIFLWCWILHNMFFLLKMVIKIPTIQEIQLQMVSILLPSCLFRVITQVFSKVCF